MTAAGMTEARRGVRIVQLTAAALAALAAGDLAAARQASGLPLGPCFAGPDWRSSWERRAHQIVDDPASAGWITGVLMADDGVDMEKAVGRAGFHGPPDARGMVEVAYAICPEHRRQGFARAALAAMLERAASDPAVLVVRATMTPANLASRAVVAPFGFVEVGMQVDDEDGPELVLELATPR